jgi:hypothetical protein
MPNVFYMMRQITSITIGIFFCLSACKNDRQTATSDQETPKALKDNSSVDVLSKRWDGDLVNNIYQEQVANSPELKEFENTVAKIELAKADSLLAFSNYDSKNAAYYSSADNQLSTIKDSVLRVQIKSILDIALKNYKKTIEQHSALLKAIDLKSATLNDAHAVLKLYKTLPVIEAYQKSALPGTKSIEAVANDYDKTIQAAKSLTVLKN